MSAWVADEVWRLSELARRSEIATDREKLYAIYVGVIAAITSGRRIQTPGSHINSGVNTSDCDSTLLCPGRRLPVWRSGGALLAPGPPALLAPVAPSPADPSSAGQLTAGTLPRTGMLGAFRAYSQVGHLCPAWNQPGRMPAYYGSR